MARTDTVTADDLAYLRKETLRVVLLCALAGLYLWCVFLYVTNDRFGPAWIGPGILLAGLAAAFISRQHRPSLAAAAIVLSAVAAVLNGMWMGGLTPASYMLAVVLSLAGLLFSLSAVAWMAALCSVSIIFIGFLHWGYSPWAAEVVSPMLVIVGVGILTSVATRNLYLTLYWVWDRGMAAQRHEEQLRDRQAQLARTSKALDEANQRLRHLNYDLARAREEAEQARLIKQQFVTNVSHELRPPLNVIVAFSEMMYLSPGSYGGVPLPAAYRGDAREIYRSSKHLLRLIDDVLDMSQVEAGRMRMDLDAVDLRDVIAEAFDMIRRLVESKRIELHAELPDSLPAVLIDRARVRQVLLNLLNNAQRFTEQGSIVVQASAEADCVRITVADTGIGVPPDQHETVFEEFRQLDGSGTRRGGSGLGLAISRRFVEMHGGRIWVESEGIPGRGSRFHFTIPVAGIGPARVTTLDRSPLHLNLPETRGRTLLLMGGDQTTTSILEQGLEHYRVVPVESVHGLPQRAVELQARAVLLITAPGNKARRRMHELRQALDQSPLPIIMCPLVGEHRMGQSLGVADYLVKPVSREALANVLERMDGRVQRILVVDDNPRMIHLLSRIIQTLDHQYEVDQAHDGQQALAKMRERRPDLVILDLVMPDMDGYGVLAQMRGEPELQHVPTVVITAHALAPEEERLLGRGVLLLCVGAGFTNAELLGYLRGLVDAIRLPPLLGTTGDAVENGQQISLSDRFLQVGFSPQ